MLTNTQRTLVQETFASILPIADDVAIVFYKRLFELDPALRRLFSADMTEQRKKLMQMLGAAVMGLNRLDQLIPVVEELGRRHARYGVKDAHYGTVGEALLTTLALALGESFTTEVKEAWTSVYSVLTLTMRKAAREAVATV
jgi:hemoglobin-like flavoprotein